MKNLFDQTRGSTSHTTNMLSLARSFGLHDSEVVYAKAGTKLVNVKGIYDSKTATFWLLPEIIGSEIFTFSAPILITNKETVNLTEYNLKFNNYHFQYKASFKDGFILTDATQVVEYDGDLYRWAGDFQKEVTANSTIDSTGGVSETTWVSIEKSGLIKQIEHDLYSGFTYKYDRSLVSDMLSVSNRKSNVIKIATWNIWGGSQRAKLFDMSRTKRFQERILHNNPDFLGMQECYFNYVYPVNTFLIYPYTECFHGVVETPANGIITTNFDYGNAFISVGKSKESASVTYTKDSTTSSDGEKRGYVRTVVNIRGTDIAFYVTHLSYDTSRFPVQMDELLEAVKKDTVSKIAVMGDFNHDEEVLFNKFVDIGFVSHNNKEFNTSNPESGTGAWYIDNILTKGFGKVISKGTDDNPVDLSDHKLFYVELEV